MTPTEVAAKLRAFNEWRRGGDIEYPGPLAVDEAIDAAVEIIERMDGALESLLIRCNDVDTCAYIDLTTSFVRDTVRIARGEQE